MQLEHPLRLGGLSRLGARLGIGQRREAVLEHGRHRALSRVGGDETGEAGQSGVGRHWGGLAALLLLPGDGGCKQLGQLLRQIVSSEAAATGHRRPGCRRSGARDRSRKTHLSPRSPRTLRTTLHNNGVAGLLFCPDLWPNAVRRRPKGRAGAGRSAVRACAPPVSRQQAASSQVVPVDPIGRMIPSAHCGNRRAECGANYGKVADSIAACDGRAGVCPANGRIMPACRYSSAASRSSSPCTWCRRVLRCAPAGRPAGAGPLPRAVLAGLDRRPRHDRAGLRPHAGARTRQPAAVGAA